MPHSGAASFAKWKTNFITDMCCTFFKAQGEQIISGIKKARGISDNDEVIYEDYILEDEFEQDPNGAIPVTLVDALLSDQDKSGSESELDDNTGPSSE